MAKNLILNAEKITRLSYSWDNNTTGLTVWFRMKKRIENTTVPLIELQATKLTEGTTSTGYWDIDCTGFNGTYYYDIEISDGVNPPIFIEKPQVVYIQTRLDNN